MPFDPELDAEIARLLDAGDVDAACMLAAKHADPRAHLAAMRIVNDYLSKRKPVTMQQQPLFVLVEATAKFANLNTTPELHGDKPEPAADLTFELNLASVDLLPMLHPELRSLLFCKLGAKQHDLADRTAELPDLRFPTMGYPLKWDLKFEAEELRIHIGTGGTRDHVFPKANISDFQLTPKNGGTVVVKFKARVHPDEKQGGKIMMLMGQDNLNISVAQVPDAPDLVDGAQASTASATPTAAEVFPGPVH